MCFLHSSIWIKSLALKTLMSCLQIASRELGVPIDLIYTNETGTHTIPVPLQTGGSMGTDVWGPAVLVKYGWICSVYWQ